jgi:hypothetical protein
MRDQLLNCLIVIGDALQEVSLDRLRQRGGWDWDLFEQVLARVEQQVPTFQKLLIGFLSGPAPRRVDEVAALLSVDRLSSAYTYWTRLFPPRQNHDESMFVLSLLHDLSEKVEHAITVLQAE